MHYSCMEMFNSCLEDVNKMFFCDARFQVDACLHGQSVIICIQDFGVILYFNIFDYLA